MLNTTEITTKVEANINNHHQGKDKRRVKSSMQHKSFDVRNVYAKDNILGAITSTSGNNFSKLRTSQQDIGKISRS